MVFICVQMWHIYDSSEFPDLNHVDVDDMSFCKRTQNGFINATIVYYRVEFVVTIKLYSRHCCVVF